MKAKWLVYGIVIALGVFLLWPSSIDAVSYTPPADKGFVGDFAFNEKLHDAEVIPLQNGLGPEDVAVDAEDRIYGGLHDGALSGFHQMVKHRKLLRPSRAEDL